MPVTPEQARTELRKRQAIVELQRRGINTNQLTSKGTPTTVLSEPVPPEEKEEWERTEWLNQQIKEGKVIPTEPTFWEGFKQTLPENIGGTAGGLAGAKIGAKAGARLPVGHPLLKGGAILAGALGGAYLGGMGGKGYQQLYQMNQPGAEPKTLTELYAEQTKAGKGQAISELVGRGIAKGIQKIGAPFAKSLKPGATEIFARMRKYGSTATASQMTESRIIDTLEGVSESAFFSTGRLQKLKTVKQPEALKKYMNDVIEDIAGGLKNRLSPTEAGEVLLDSLEKGDTAFRAAANKAYATVDNLSQKIPGLVTRTAEGKFAGKAIVDMKPLRNRAAQIIKRVAPSKGLGSSSAIESLAKKVSEIEDTTNFMTAHQIRSDILQEVRKLEVGELGSKNPKLQGVANELVGIIDNQMEISAKRGGEDVYNAWRAANTFYKTGKETFNSKVVQSLSKKLADDPQAAVKTVFRPGATRNIKTIYGLLDPQTQKSLTSAYIEDLMSASTKDETIIGKSFFEKIHDRYISENL